MVLSRFPGSTRARNIHYAAGGFDRAALMLICLFFLIRIRLFRELLHKSAHSPKELLAVTAIFSLFALFSTGQACR